MNVSIRTLAAGAAGALLLVSGLAGPVSAREGFDEVPLADTATCDFSGGTDYVDYEVADSTQTVLQQVATTVDGRGYNHTTVIAVFDGVEYVSATAEPSRFFYNSTIVAVAVLDRDGTLVSYSQRGSAVLSDVDGSELYRGPLNFDFVVVDGEPVDYVFRGPVGPCVPGID